MGNLTRRFALPLATMTAMYAGASGCSTPPIERDGIKTDADTSLQIPAEEIHKYQAQLDRAIQNNRPIQIVGANIYSPNGDYPFDDLDAITQTHETVSMMVYAPDCPTSHFFRQFWDTYRESNPNRAVWATANLQNKFNEGWLKERFGDDYKGMRVVWTPQFIFYTNHGENTNRLDLKGIRTQEEFDRRFESYLTNLIIFFE